MATIIGDGIQPQKQRLYRGCLPGMYKWDWIDLTSNCLGYTLLRFQGPHLDHWMTAVTKDIPYANGKTALFLITQLCIPAPWFAYGYLSTRFAGDLQERLPVDNLGLSVESCNLLYNL